MTESETFAWILLSVPANETLRDLIGMADAINRAIPTHRELQMSLGWLASRDLVLRNGRNIFLTQRGIELLARVKAENTSLRALEMIAAELDCLRGEAAPLDDVTVEELNSAYAAYGEYFKEMLRALREGDA